MLLNIIFEQKVLIGKCLKFSVFRRFGIQMMRTIFVLVYVIIVLFFREYSRRSTSIEFVCNQFELACDQSHVFSASLGANFFPFFAFLLFLLHWGKCPVDQLTYARSSMLRTWNSLNLNRGRFCISRSPHPLSLPLSWVILNFYWGENEDI